ncbi:DMT family transporter [Metabacillus sp. HB246100]
MRNLAYLYIIIGATFWGVIGIFVTTLYNAGFTPIQVVAIRSITACVFLLSFVLIARRELLIIKVSDSKLFIGTGIISIIFFNWCLFSAIKETSLSVASILLYTAPAFVTLFSRIFFKELLTRKKVVALLITLIGCILVIGVFPLSNQSVSLYGIVLGIGSGLFYSLYSIFGKLALKKYHSITVTVYTFIFAASAIIPFSGLWENTYLFSNIKVWFAIIGLGLLSTVLAFIFYTKGLELIETSKASIIATIEPVVASLTGFFLFNEKLTLWQYFGISLVILAVIIVQEQKRKSHETTYDKRDS